MASNKKTNDYPFNFILTRCIYIEDPDREYYTVRYKRGSYEIFFDKIWEYKTKNIFKKKPIELSIGDIDKMKKYFRYQEIWDFSKKIRRFKNSYKTIEFEQELPIGNIKATIIDTGETLWLNPEIPGMNMSTLYRWSMETFYKFKEKNSIPSGSFLINDNRNNQII